MTKTRGKRFASVRGCALALALGALLAPCGGRGEGRGDTGERGHAGRVTLPSPHGGGQGLTALPERGHENIEWSIAYAFHLTDAQKGLPRVLLIGDSICNGYQDEVRAMAEGKFNVSYWVSSYCVTSPCYLKLLEIQMDEAKYDVVHFNNGLHSLGCDPAVYAEGLRRALALIRRKQPQARIVWATSTPLKDPVLTKKVRKLNAAGAALVKDAGVVATDDLFALLDPLDRAANWSDTFHHRPAVQKKAAEAVVQAVLPFVKR